MAEINKKFLDENGLLYYHGKNKEALAKKVDKIDGKGLSTNDFTTEEKTKLAAIEENANKYELPAATAEKLGGVKVGDRLSITADGVLSATVQETVVDSALSETSANPVQNKVVKAELDKKVTKVTGKDLSTNDYTTEDKNKLKDIAANAQVNVLEAIAVNGTDQTITNKKVDISVPTKVSDLTNDTGFITSASIDEKEDKTNKVISIIASNTDEQYPSAKAVYTGLSGKVDKIDGKGLSTNDYTTTEKNKLNGIAEGAQVNVLEGVKVNGTGLVATDKVVDITVPTKLSELTNDDNYAKISDIPTDLKDLANTTTNFQNATQVQALIDASVGEITGVEFKIVETLPDVGQGKTGVIYLVAHSHSAEDGYDEYIWIKGDAATGTQDRFEKIGSTDIDLSEYWNTTNLTVISNADIDKILAK